MADCRPRSRPGRFNESFIRLQSLVKATRRGNITEVRELLKAGVSVNCTAGGVTALHVAAAHNHVDCAEILLENNAKVNQTISDGVTPLHVAVRFESLACVVLFVNYAADVNGVNKEGWTPLHLAARNGNVQSAKILISKNADVDVPIQPRSSSRSQDDNLFPLHFAARHGHSKCVDLLARNGADVNRQTGKSAMTPLHLAVQHGHLDCSCVLLAYGSLTDVADFSGNTPLHISSRTGSEEATELLLQAGANTEYFNHAGKRALDIAKGSVRSVLESLIGQPKSLTYLCVQTIRRSLPLNGSKIPLDDFVSCLPLPFGIRQKLALKDVVDIIKC